MDRNMVYPGAIPLDTDVLTVERSILVAIGALAQATLGVTTCFNGFACTQQAAPNLSVLVSPGSALSLQVVDANPFGSLAANAAPLVKMGVLLTSTTLNTPAPITSGQSINYLVEASYQETDTTSVVLPYYNSANPAVPFSGPANSGTPQNTQRLETVSVQIKAGTPATTGTQTTPAADGGYTGLYVVTVAFGATTVLNANITQLTTAPLIDGAQVGRGVQQGRLLNVQTFVASGTYTPTPGMQTVIFEVQGGGASGGGTTATGAGAAAAAGGGSAGAYAKGRFTAAAVGASQVVTVGASVTGTAGASGTNGNLSSVGSLISAPGGLGGAGSGPTTSFVAAGGAGGAATAAPTGGNIESIPGAQGLGGLVYGASNAAGGLGGISKSAGPGNGGPGALAPQSTGAVAGFTSQAGKIIAYEYS